MTNNKIHKFRRGQKFRLTPGIQSKVVIQRVKLQILKCC